MIVALLVMSRVAFGDVADELATDDPRAAVAAIEAGSASPELLYAAARACEDKLADPAHALAIYRRILRDAPSSAAAVAAARRATELAALVGDNATAAAAFAALVANADRTPVDDVIARGDALAATTSWSGAPAAELWLAEWLRRIGRFEAAQLRYARVSSDEAREDAAGCALDAHEWARAEAMARALPDDDVVKPELIAAARRGRARARLDASAYIVLALAFVALVVSWLEASSWRRPKLAPPIELWFALPIAGVLIAVSATANRLIAPAVATISVAGIASAWIAGAASATLANGGRRRRAVLHVVLCLLAVVAAAYVALVNSGLVELVVETVTFGPGT